MSQAGAIPVSQALTIQSDPHSQAFRKALDVIDSLHGDGVLPVIPLRRAFFTDKRGQFIFQQGGPAVAILVSYFTTQAELTTIHEIGHFVDYHGLGNGTQCASVSGVMLQGWRNAVRGSGAVQRMGGLWRSSAGTVSMTQGDGAVVQCPVSQRHLQYLLMPQELWARSYAQFIVNKSSDPDLARQLSAQRQKPVFDFYYEAHWEDEDFAPIGAEIEVLFRQKGWIK